jgi:hypothetical protein
MLQPALRRTRCARTRARQHPQETWAAQLRHNLRESRRRHVSRLFWACSSLLPPLSMVLPKAPPAGAPAAPSQAVCGLCGEEAKETESDLVELFCNQGDCEDTAGRRYHRNCMSDHISKTGRVRKTHGGVNDLRQIQRMELTGA